VNFLFDFKNVSSRINENTNSKIESTVLIVPLT